MITLTRRSFLGATLCAAALPLRLHAASAYPDGRPIRLIVPYTPGGGTDSVARAIAAKITGAAGWSVVVENRPGAGGNIGMDYVAKTRPDGFMLGLGQTANLAINPALMAKMPFDAAKDFAAVAMVASLPVVLVVKANARWNTLADLVKEARAQPGNIKQALAGSGTVGHLAGELLAYQAKFQVLNVPYRGAAPALNDLLGENTDYMFATPQAAQEMLKGKVLRPLAVTSRERLSILPDVPTVAESGFDGFEAVDWKALVAPAGTPPEIIAQVNGVVEKVLADPATIAMFTAEGSKPMGGSPQSAQQYILDEQQKWARLIREANIQTAA
ncbi:tripartite tricarboxylate transporter substrate binding protein [Achromobacter sp. LC458]|uniref:Tripartite tricarboxylate transporter substrate binding protein n=1 Tax=Achromobacter spanius TaxID=217203 RepID=A0A2S5GKK7_9BURK|nr:MULTISPECIES: tripartite tricarboxylate transporter substrate binding protein [Achromobacter]AYD65045.1 tripartite tricarboxylate transporter substrate binding protein [Achromobacter sp. B7]PPA73519.1 tripartite tricarboxylate transporter substrate binding protein [Achromobacter spanius]QYJ19190.1 tripartite tricarboxylate transporter substrate binding protein [Achromobacter sp. ES-001]TRM49935.1 tripartite tricarboxylate transporter substrate binding protein [Achromobacter sp. LC458]